MAKQEKRISYQAGITRSPSDFLCQDGELAECINLTTDNEELKPMVQPAQDMTGVAGTLIFVHRYNNEKRYIIRDGNQFKWGTKYEGAYSAGQIYVPDSYSGDVFVPGHYEDQVLFEVTGDVKVTAIGKFLIFTTSEGLKYCMWNANIYKVFDKIPEPNIEFALSKQSASGDVSLFTDDATIDWKTYVEETKEFSGSIFEPGAGQQLRIYVKNQEAYNNLMTGLYAKQKKTIDEKKAFSLPFFIRTAVELYDGTYIYISQPILMFPSVTRNTYCEIVSYDGEDETGILKYRTELAHLYYRSLYDYSEWNDIVKGVTVFISAPIEINDIWSDLVDTDVYDRGDINIDRIVGINYKSEFEEDTTGSEYQFCPFEKREDLEVNNEITSTSIFYKLAEIGLTGTGMSGEHNGWKAMDGQFEKRTLETLTSQERLKKDDSYSRCSLQADMLYAYNSRLNIAGIKRGFFGGYGFFLPYDNNSEAEYTALVRIKTDSGNRIVKKVWTTNQKQGIWFYYPDPRAEYVTIWCVKNGATYCSLDAKLTEHSGLNGAYYFRGVPTSGYVDTVTPSADAIPINTTESVDPELMPNQIATSEVYNPFVFVTYNAVGTGRILAMATQTEALSQGKFGECPLIVFTDMGLWGMSVDKTGLYEDIKPMPREVCINPNSILETDGAVFFVAKKGLMVIVGKDVRCVSEQMNGRTFNTATLPSLGNDIDAQGAATYDWASVIKACQGNEAFLDYIRDENCMMAYDYIDSRILIINKSLVKSSPKYGFSYVYNIADGTLSKLILPFQPSAIGKSVVNDYPDYLIQSGTIVYTLYNKLREDEIQSRQRAFILTRPIKMAGPLTVSSLRELANVGMWDRGTQQNPLKPVQTVVWLSDDLLTWREMSSRFGAAAKYFRIGLFINMLPTERLSGTIITEQERRTDNLRA